MLTDHPDPVSSVIPNHWRMRRERSGEATEPEPRTATAVQLTADGVNAHESGFDIRTGWAGRSH